MSGVPKTLKMALDGINSCFTSTGNQKTGQSTSIKLLEQLGV